MTSALPFSGKRLLGFLAAACLLLADFAYAGTVTGTIRTPTGRTINRCTLTFNLSQPMIQAGFGIVVLKVRESSTTRVLPPPPLSGVGRITWGLSVSLAVSFPCVRLAD